MRHILLSCAILLLALSFCLFSMLHIREICKQTLCALTSAQEQAQIYNFEACRASMQQALRIWRQYERYFGLTLTHSEIELALGAPAIDRVTLYRVLDWLVDSGLAHKSADASRVFRYSAAAAGEHTTHVHFRCEHCGGVFCLEAAPPAAPRLPAGFSLTRMDFDLRGCCARCAAHGH